MAYAVTGAERRLEGALIAAAVVLQLALAPQISIAGGRINFMLILAAVTALDGNERGAVLTGFACGLLYDLSAPVPIGLMALMLTLASFALARVSPPGSSVPSLASIRSVVMFSFAVSILYALLLMLMGRESDPFVALVEHGLTSAILTALIAVPFLFVKGSGNAKRAGARRLRSVRLKERR
ncbi:rod shape-determining protein MreD [Coriobacterium glomerans PW2]|uniref:Rod shape-determining protein MreD n=1 Tax=Coriobacterium glomerans (strain ATCC 49209 / DSM 20642 / JCM 10262 / PW2) TaxID=700015 RepID=F2N7S6_CORGP|nr:rod shape-determining protein MreD [Coriobacterium glomerans]AEB06968.1 rod shape-determining protein MreD [Coriobacterium glomerans PW2]